MVAHNTALRPTVIFDLGGVLVSVDFMRACARLETAGGAPAAVVLECIHSGADKLGFDTGRLSPQEFAARFCASIGVRLPYAEFAQIWCDIFAEQRDVTSLLDEVAGKADLMLLSNTDPLHFDHVRSHYGFLARFGQLVLSYEVGHAKPQRQIFERAISLCAPGGRTIYFDDIPGYVSAARACGLPAEQFVDAATLRRDLQRFGVL
ncbi:MAG: HAD family phosphatase [Burkholderiales bacterium]|nr:HAD family phosphatase [Burkholderiales bacterium]